MRKCIIHALKEIADKVSGYTEYAGLNIALSLCIASPFSRRIVIGNAGPILTLESMGGKPTFRCHFLNIGPSYKQ